MGCMKKEKGAFSFCFAADTAAEALGTLPHQRVNECVCTHVLHTRVCSIHTIHNCVNASIHPHCYCVQQHNIRLLKRQDNNKAAATKVLNAHGPKQTCSTRGVTPPHSVSPSLSKQELRSILFLRSDPLKPGGCEEEREREKRANMKGMNNKCGVGGTRAVKGTLIRHDDID